MILHIVSSCKIDGCSSPWPDNQRANCDCSRHGTVVAPCTARAAATCGNVGVCVALEPQNAGESAAKLIAYRAALDRWLTDPPTSFEGRIYFYLFPMFTLPIVKL